MDVQLAPICESNVIEDQEFLNDVMLGLNTKGQKVLNPKYFYDKRGVSLFEEITRLDEYYVTRSELKLMESAVNEIKDEVGDLKTLVELGSGSGARTELCLEELNSLDYYLPVDVSVDFISSSQAAASERYAGIRVVPVVADFSLGVKLPSSIYCSNVMVYFPGSTISNFGLKEAKKIFNALNGSLAENAWFLVTADLKKEKSIIESAYNDAEGVTAQFNLNILERINRELGADFELNAFEHRAFYNEDESRIEMHLVSLEEQSVNLNGEELRFDLKETIHTENSYKFSVDDIEELAEATGWELRRAFVEKGARVGQFLLKKSC